MSEVIRWRISGVTLIFGYQTAMQHAIFERKFAMRTVTVRKLAGAAIVTLPAEVLEILNIEVGSQLDLDVRDGVLTVRPAAGSKRYPIAEFLHGRVGVTS